MSTSPELLQKRREPFVRLKPSPKKIRHANTEVDAMLPSKEGPFAGLLSTGAQWAEGRGFLRQYEGNPYAQSRLLEAVVGLYKIPSHNYGANPEHSPDMLERTEERFIIASFIRVLDQYFKEWRTSDYKIDSDFGMPDYTVEELLLHEVDEILGEHFPDDDN